MGVKISLNMICFKGGWDYLFEMSSEVIRV